MKTTLRCCGMWQWKMPIAKSMVGFPLPHFIGGNNKHGNMTGAQNEIPPSLVDDLNCLHIYHMAVLRMIGVSTRSLQRNLQLQRGAAFRVNNLTHAPAAWGFAMSCQHQVLDQDPHHQKKNTFIHHFKPQPKQPPMKISGL